MEKKEKKEYQAPKLKNYGCVTQITEALGATYLTDEARTGSMETNPKS